MRFEVLYLGQHYEGEFNSDSEAVWVESIDISPLELDERIIESGLDSHRFLRGLNDAVRNQAAIQLVNIAALERAEDLYIAKEWRNEMS